MPAVPEPAHPMMGIRHVYLHAPFCPRRCSYCDFPVTATEGAPTEEWLRALTTELELVEDEGRFAPGRKLDTLYVGGGTPSHLGSEAMRGITRLLGRARVADPELEWTVEANPESFSDTLARSWAEAGVNRVSLGVQSFQAPVLRWLNRIHGPEEARTAVRHARKEGIQNISLDLMFGLPQVMERDWNRDLDETLALSVPHISLYGLSVEEGTPLAREMKIGRVPRPVEEQYREEFLQAGDRLVSEGYQHYEVSNYALPGYESRHNRACWDLKPYLGLGNGAHSFKPPWRRWNVREWSDYRRACDRGRSPVDAEEALTPTDARLEELWLGLRTDRGVGTGDWRVEADDLMTSWVFRGYATHENETLRLTPVGWLLLDHLVVELEQALGPHGTMG